MPEQYPPEEIALLYRRRWQAELHLRSFKIVLQMDHLRCKTPERVRNEFYMHLVGYNLIRGVMAVAAYQSGQSPWEISFKGTLQTLSQFLPLLLASATTEAWCEALLTAVATHVVGNRPDRFEPRRVKRPQNTTASCKNTGASTQSEMRKAVRQVQVPFRPDPLKRLALSCHLMVSAGVIHNSLGATGKSGSICCPSLPIIPRRLAPCVWIVPKLLASDHSLKRLNCPE